MAICQPWANYASAASVGHRVIGVSSKQQWPGWWWVGGCYCTWFSGNFRIDDAWWFHGVLPSCLKGRPPAAGNSRGSVVRVVRSVNFQGEWSLWRAPGVLAGAFRGLTSSNKRPRKITNGTGVSMVGNPWLSTCNRVVTPAVGMTWFSLKLCSWEYRCHTVPRQLRVCTVVVPRSSVWKCQALKIFCLCSRDPSVADFSIREFCHFYNSPSPIWVCCPQRFGMSQDVMWRTFLHQGSWQIWRWWRFVLRHTEASRPKWPQPLVAVLMSFKAALLLRSLEYVLLNCEHLEHITTWGKGWVHTNHHPTLSYIIPVCEGERFLGTDGCEVWNPGHG